MPTASCGNAIQDRDHGHGDRWYDEHVLDDQVLPSEISLAW